MMRLCGCLSVRVCASGSHPESRRRPRWSASSRGAACDPGWSVAETCPRPPSPPPPSCPTLFSKEEKETHHHQQQQQGFLSDSHEKHQQPRNPMLQTFMEKEAQSSKVDEAINERTSIRKTTWRWFTEREKKKRPKRFWGGVRTKPAVFPSCCSRCRLFFPGKLLQGLVQKIKEREKERKRCSILKKKVT